jgi:hypothetical protein
MCTLHFSSCYCTFRWYIRIVHRHDWYDVYTPLYDRHPCTVQLLVTVPFPHPKLPQGIVPSKYLPSELSQRLSGLAEARTRGSPLRSGSVLQAYYRSTLTRRCRAGGSTHVART